PLRYGSRHSPRPWRGIRRAWRRPVPRRFRMLRKEADPGWTRGGSWRGLCPRKRKPRLGRGFLDETLAYCFSRKFWWQPPQVLPTPPIAAFCAASSPPRETETRFWTAFWKLSWASWNLAGSLQIAGSAAVLTVASLLAATKPSQGILLRASSMAELNATVSAL